MFIKTLSVSELSTYLKNLLDHDFILNNLSIKGEISNFKLHTSGNIYFTLKDEASKINCVLFREETYKLNFLPEDGMKVVVSGRVSLYVKNGSYELFVKEVSLAGEGELKTAFLKLKEELNKQGLFLQEHKKALPKYVSKVGVITSETGAAVLDIINVIKRRNPLVTIHIYNSLVQGFEAPKEIISGIKYFNKRKDIDIVIIARGGGSIEELWAFNDENLAREIYNSNKPIITGIGHENDYTIADYVSDLRAPTPSAAAEISVPSRTSLYNDIDSMNNKLKANMENIIEDKINTILRKGLIFKSLNPLDEINKQKDKLLLTNSLLRKSINAIILNKEKEWINKTELLEAKSPMALLKKGYTLIIDSDDKILNSIKGLKKEDALTINFFDGKCRAIVNEVILDSGEKERNLWRYDVKTK